MSEKAEKAAIRPAWWKNTYFWIAIILVVIAFIGIIKGEKTIRDPGQREESHLVLIYLVGAIVMFINGLLSHRQALAHFEEQHEGVSS